MNDKSAPWADQIRELRNETEAALKTAISIYERDSPELPSGVKPEIRQVIEALESIRSRASQLFERFCSGPFIALVTARGLTREQYHLLLAEEVMPLPSAKDLGLEVVDDYELFCLFCHEDDKSWFYINPFARLQTEVVEDGRTKLYGRFGRPPEEVSRASLRKDQDAFFRNHLPQVYTRFKTA